MQDIYGFMDATVLKYKTEDQACLVTGGQTGVTFNGGTSKYIDLYLAYDGSTWNNLPAGTTCDAKFHFRSDLAPELAGLVIFFSVDKRKFTTVGSGATAVYCASSVASSIIANNGVCASSGSFNW